MKSVGHKRLIVWGVVGVVLVVLLVVALAPRPVPADFEIVERGPLQVTLDHEGRTRVRYRFVISAPFPGRVQRIELEPGDPVVAHETVTATFVPSDPDLLDARSRAQARAEVKAAQATLERTSIDRDRVRVESNYAEGERRRNQSLFDQGITSSEVLAAAVAEADARREALLSAESAILAASHRLEAARARLVEPASDGSDGASVIRLRSPIDGVVLRRLRESEAVVPAGEPLLEVADPANLEVVADYLSSDAVRIRPGMPVMFDQWGGDHVLNGRVRRVEPAGFMKISALGVEEQRVNVIADFDDPHEAWEALGDEYRVEVRVVTWEQNDVLIVPTSCLFRHGEGWAVFAVDDGRAQLTEVEIGRSNGLHAEVLGGLEAGRQLIAHPSDAVEDNVRVEQR